eukprot:2298525-Rhodomonas_salina.2
MKGLCQRTATRRRPLMKSSSGPFQPASGGFERSVRNAAHHTRLSSPSGICGSASRMACRHWCADTWPWPLTCFRNCRSTSIKYSVRSCRYWSRTPSKNGPWSKFSSSMKRYSYLTLPVFSLAGATFFSFFPHGCSA